jgi:ketopantoate reductase
MTSIIKSVLVLGAGAKGSFIAARLHEKGVNVTIMSHAERCAEIALRSLHIQSFDGRFRKPVPAITSAEISSKFDLIIAACRAHLLVDALDLAAPAMRAGTAILSLADGGPHLPFLRRRYTLRPVLEGIFEARLMTDADGVIRHRPPAARIQLRNDGRDEVLLAEVQSLLTGRGLMAGVVDDFERLAWMRSIFLAAAVGTMLHSGRPLRDALRLNSGAGHFSYLARDGREIAEKFGITVTPSMLTGYVMALGFEGEPIASPAPISSAGPAGAESLYLLANLVDRAEQRGCRAGSLKFALRMADRTINPIVVNG